MLLRSKSLRNTLLWGLPLLALFFLWSCTFALSFSEQVSVPLFSWTTEYITRILNYSSFDNEFVMSKLTRDDRLQAIINAFCTSALLAQWLHTDDGFVYNANSSVFVYLLCVHSDSSFADFFSPELTSSLQTTSFSKLSIPHSNLSLAHTYVGPLFAKIVNEYFNVRQAWIYGMQTPYTSQLSFEDQINSFTADYFGPNIKICTKKANTDPYVFDKTCTYMKDYLKNVKKNLNSLELLDIKKIYTTYDKRNLTVCKEASKNDGSYNLLTCGLLNIPWEKTLWSFVNLIYNEYLYYTLFVKYYSNRLLQEPSMGDDRLVAAQSMENDLQRSKDAMTMSLRMLRDAHMNFPLHIWFLMYWEDVRRFGSEIAKIASPINLLYKEFTHIQCKK